MPRTTRPAQVLHIHLSPPPDRISEDSQFPASYTRSSKSTTGVQVQRKYRAYPSTQHTPNSAFSEISDTRSERQPVISAWRAILRQLSAEFIGTMILVIMGAGVNCQTTLSTVQSVSSSPKGNYTSVSLAWGAGLALGVWVSSGISGGHINPAVTLVQAIFRGFPWKKVPGYILAQISGACAGAGLVYANYYRAIDLYEGGAGIRTVPGTASLFATFAPDYQSNALCFYEEALGTFLLVFIILAITDKYNGPTPSVLLPIALFFFLMAESASIGMQTSFALNPARDLGPRLLCWFVGYGIEVWNYRSQYWLYTPIIGPLVGGIMAAVVYDILLYTDQDNIFYKSRKMRSEERESQDQLDMAEHGQADNRV